MRGRPLGPLARARKREQANALLAVAISLVVIAASVLAAAYFGVR